MAKTDKSKLILDALQHLMEERDIQHISVSDIAQKAGIGKGSIYYYFPSKDAILDALIRRNYEQPIETAKNLVEETNVSCFTKMAVLFQVCRRSSTIFLNNCQLSEASEQSLALLHKKHLHYLISQLKPVLSEIISQGIEKGEFKFDYPNALAEIVLIVLTVKLDTSIVPTTPEETELTIKGLISLLEKGTDLPEGTLNYLTI